MKKYVYVCNYINDQSSLTAGYNINICHKINDIFHLIRFCNKTG